MAKGRIGSAIKAGPVGGPAATEYLLYGDVGYEITDQDFVNWIATVAGKDITIGISSMGGNVFMGQAIYNSMIRHGRSRITVRVDSLAASIASYIAMAGGKVLMAAGSQMMIHRPHASGFAMTRDDLREIIDQLDALETVIRAAYVKRTGQPEADIREMMSRDCYISAERCVELGFADEIEADVEALAAVATRYAAPADMPVHLAARLVRLDDGTPPGRGKPAGAEPGAGGQGQGVGTRDGGGRGDGRGGARARVLAYLGLSGG